MASAAVVIVSRGEDLYLKMLLVDNLMHADLHPGNILVQVTCLEAATLSKTARPEGMRQRHVPREVKLTLHCGHLPF